MQEMKLIELSVSDYKSSCEEMRDLLRLEKEIEARKQELRKIIIQKSGGNRMEYGIKVQKVTSKGSIDYRALAEELIRAEQLRLVEEKYRKKEVEKFVITSY